MNAEEKPKITLSIFDSPTRIEILRLLLNFQIMSLSEMSRRLLQSYNRKISLPGLLGHMRELELAGIVRQERGYRLDNPDARKRVYYIIGKERVEELIASWCNLDEQLKAGMGFNELSKTAEKVLVDGSVPQPDEIKLLEKMIEKCSLNDIYCHLTMQERKKINFWKVMLEATGKM